MTKTVQLRSLPMLEKTSKNLAVNKDKTGDDSSPLFSIYDNLNNLFKALTKMNNVQNKLYEKLIRLDNIVHNI